MFYKFGLSTYYGPNFICHLGEIASSEIWYEERQDFSRAAIGTDT